MGTQGKIYKVFRYASTSARSCSESRSSNPGIPTGLPLLINSITVASLTFFLLAKFALLNNPFKPGPTFGSALSVLWQTSQLESNVSLPLAASPGLAAPDIVTLNAVTPSNATPASSSRVEDETLR